MERTPGASNVVAGTLGTDVVVARDAALTPMLAGGAFVWLALWAAHTLLNAVSAGQPFRCQACGSTPASPAAVADATEAQRLQAALAKAAAKRAGATARA